MADQPRRLSAHDRRAQRVRRTVVTVVAGAAAAASVGVVYQLRYESDNRHVEVGVVEHPQGIDGAASFRSCLPPGAVLTLLNTVDRYRVDFVATRPALDRAVACIESRPGVRYADRLEFFDLQS